MKTVIVRYGELFLKSGPVSRNFENALIGSIRLCLGKRKYAIRRERGRIFIECRGADAVAKKIARLPGVTSTSPAIATSAETGEMIRAAVQLARGVLRHGKSFAVRARRHGKHPFTSMEINAKIGAAILKKIDGVRVNLASPEVEIHVEIRGDRAFVYTDIIPGTGGLPLGTQGRIVALMTGDMQDALAAYLMMKRGAVVIPLFVHSGTGGYNEVLRKVRKQVKALRAIDPCLRLHVIQTQKQGDLPDLVKSFARANEAMALVTGMTPQKAEWLRGTDLLTLYPVFGLEDEADALLKRAGLAGLSDNGGSRVTRGAQI